MTLTQTTGKLSPTTTWLFAFGSIALGILASYALSGLGQKVTAGAYFAIVGVGGYASMYFTRARLGGAIVSFLVGALVAAGVYFKLVDAIFSTAVTTMADVSSNGDAHAQGVQAGHAMGTIFGIFVAVIVFLETTVAGIGGAIAGSKARS